MEQWLGVVTTQNETKTPWVNSRTSAGNFATREDLQNLRQQIAQLCKRMEQSGILNPLNPLTGDKEANKKM